MGNSDNVSRLRKSTVAAIAFFFGVGMLCTAVGIGMSLPVAARLALAHPETTLKALASLCLLPVAWLLGLPVAKLLERR